MMITSQAGFGSGVRSALVNIWNRYDRWIERLTRWTSQLGGFLILVVGFFVFYEVICRYLLNSPTVWVMDFSIYFVMWAVFLGAAHTMRTRGHVMVDVVVKKLPRGFQRWIQVVIHFLIFAFCLTLALAGLLSCIRAVRMNELTMSALYIPLVYPLSAVPAGFFLLALEEFRAFTGLVLMAGDGRATLGSGKEEF